MNRLLMKSAKQLLGARGLLPHGEVQSFVDKEAVEKSNIYVPKRSGTLAESAIKHTKIGSGQVVYGTHYARRQYYGTKKTRSYDALRGGYWFARMKAAHAKNIEQGAKKISGAK